MESHKNKSHGTYKTNVNYSIKGQPYASSITGFQSKNTNTHLIITLYCSLKPYPCITHLASLGTFGCTVRDDLAQFHNPIVNLITPSPLNLIVCGTSPVISLFNPQQSELGKYK
jgi:hypothetical protein